MAQNKSVFFFPCCIYAGICMCLSLSSTIMNMKQYNTQIHVTIMRIFRIWVKTTDNYVDHILFTRLSSCCCVAAFSAPSSVSLVVGIQPYFVYLSRLHSTLPQSLTVSNHHLSVPRPFHAQLSMTFVPPSRFSLLNTSPVSHLASG